MSTPALNIQALPGFPPERKIPPLDFVVYRDKKGLYFAQIRYGGFLIEERKITLAAGCSYTMTARLG